MSEIKQLEMAVVERALHDAGFSEVLHDRNEVTGEVVVEQDGALAAAMAPRMVTKYEVVVLINGSVNVVRTRSLKGTAREAVVGGVVPVRVCGHSEDVTEFVAAVESVQDLMGVIAWVRNERGTGTVPNGTARSANRASGGAIAAVSAG
jgi:hypothetical protein